MKVTNELGLPQPLVDAVSNDSYSKGDADISVTALLSPPRIRALQEKHGSEITEDASDRIWSLLGQVVHGILERADTTGVSEKRHYMKIGGWTISGQVDRYIDGALSDYKFITAYKFKNNQVPEEFQWQLNCYAELLRQNGHPVNKLEIVGILRDWSKLEARRDPNYPQRQVLVLDVPLWPEAKVKAFLAGRVKLHQDALKVLPECSMEERWARPTVWAVHKEGRKTAIKLHDNETSAKNHAASEPDLYVDKRPGESIRCGSYCSVSNFCEQYQKSIKEKSHAISKTGT